jgi:hypothetical protein
METASSALSPPEAVLCALCASVVNCSYKDAVAASSRSHVTPQTARVRLRHGPTVHRASTGSGPAPLGAARATTGRPAAA